MANKRILIVDDEAPIRRLLERGFRGLNADFVFGASAEEALEKMDENSIDMLITDLKLPDHDGAYIISHFLKRFPGRPVAVITGLLQPESVLNETMKDLINHVFLKPFAMDEIRNAVLILIQR